MHKGHKRISIGELCEFINGNGFRPSDWKSTGLPIIRIQNLNGSANFNYFDGIPKDKWIVEPGDLLFAWAGVKGVSFGPAIWPGSRGVLNQHIFRVEPKNGIDRYWLYLALQMVTRRIERSAHGFKASLVHVHKDDITDQIVDLPPIQEQREIADILRTWDEAIEKAEALHAAKRKRLSALASRLINDPQYDRHQLKGFLQESSRRNQGQHVRRVLSVTNSSGFVLAEEQFAHRVASVNLSNYKIICRGQYAYNPSRINVGSIARMEDWDDGVLSPMYVVFEVKGALGSDFFGHWLVTSEAKQRIRRAAQGSVRETVGFAELGTIMIPVPKPARQRQIAEVLDTGKEEIGLVEKEILVLAQQKRGLVQKLLTGEWRIKDAAEEAIA